MSLTITDTKYYGVYIHRENEEHWIVDNNDNSQFFGAKCPSITDIDNYVQKLYAK